MASLPSARKIVAGGDRLNCEIECPRRLVVPPETDTLLRSVLRSFSAASPPALSRLSGWRATRTTSRLGWLLCHSQDRNLPESRALVELSFQHGLTHRPSLFTRLLNGTLSMTLDPPWSWRAIRYLVTMNTAVVTETTCGICLEESKDPLYLPCGHSFCGVCLNEWRSRFGVAEEMRRKCPICRARIPPSKEMVATLLAYRADKQRIS